MGNNKHILTREKDRAECPHCSTICRWDWKELGADSFCYDINNNSNAKVLFSQCANCDEDVLFYKDILIFPVAQTKATNNEFFGNYPNALKLFNEASAIVDISPQAALALSKMCLESLVQEILNENGMKCNTFLENINALVGGNIIDGNIKNLVTDVRIIGSQGAPIFNLINNNSFILNEDARIVLNIVMHIIKTITGFDSLKKDLTRKM